ncbi:MAG: hypothetical protein ACK46Q_13305 [Hyphomonas sp.]
MVAEDLLNVLEVPEWFQFGIFGAMIATALLLLWFSISGIKQWFFGTISFLPDGDHLRTKKGSLGVHLIANPGIAKITEAAAYLEKIEQYQEGNWVTLNHAPIRIGWVRSLDMADKAEKITLLPKVDDPFCVWDAIPEDDRGVRLRTNIIRHNDTSHASINDLLKAWPHGAYRVQFCVRGSRILKSTLELTWGGDPKNIRLKSIDE